MSDQITNISSPAAGLHPLIKERWSPRVFAAQTINPEQLKLIFQAAQWAPSCFNEQPWRFIVATRDDTEEFQRLLSCLVPANQEWAKDAGALVIAVTSTTFARNGKDNGFAWHDVGLAVGQLVMQASALDLHTHQMGGFSSDKARELYNIPEDFEPVSAIAIGTREQNSEKAQEEAKKPRSRRELSSTVFSKDWGSASKFIDQ